MSQIEQTQITKSQVLNVTSYVLMGLLAYLWVANDARRSEEHRQFVETMEELREAIHSNDVDIATLQNKP